MIPGATLADWVNRHASRRPQQIALQWRDHRIDWRTCRNVAGRIAAGLDAAGVRRGDRVALMMSNRLEMLELFVATARLGAIFAPINTRFGPRELKSVLENADPTVIVTDTDGRDRLKDLGRWSDSHHLYTLDEAYDPELAGLAKSASPPEPVGELDDIATLVYTSGTTGDPKGVPHTWRALHWNYRQFIDGLELTPGDRNLCPAPLSHVAGLNVLTLPLMYLGGTSLLCGRFEPTEVPTLIDQYELTCSFLVPAMWKRTFRHGEWTEAASALRFGVVGGAPVNASLIRRARDEGVELIQGYGMTEAGPNVSLLRSDDPRRHATSVGVSGMHVDTRIVSRKEADGDGGELAVRGPNVAREYWNKPEESRKSFDGEWYLTGDMARRREDGEIQLLGRVDDMILSGSENVHPREVENVLSRHEAIDEVAVVGLDDDRWGQLVTAVITPADGSVPSLRDLMEFVRSELADYKAPRQIAIADELAYTPTGKVHREEIVARIERGDVDLCEKADDEDV